ncbi:hypothetical protein QJS10_CPA01g01660 [Acorus calamus]|uniref:Uncharacterized protein n=1 Tax=Acorus calamus TaxID=4465 RepID=A0AAV9FFR1_ACOCL|nr:hypothetical protein QJS10_CPA01g01660 [Acorus calamus]
MGNGVNLTDGLDGLAGGTAALAFIGMSIAVLPISSGLAIFGVSMAGSCIGFLFHNGYSATLFMGDTGALALGGALAAMAACTGMFLPLFISSGVFVLEVVSVITQVKNSFINCRAFHIVFETQELPLVYQMDSSKRYSYNPTLHWNPQVEEYFINAYGAEHFD